MSVHFQKRLIDLSVFVLLIFGLGIRLYDLNWDDNHHIHPDERWITMVAMDTAMPDNFSDALDPRRSALNPYWNVRERQPRHFAYGSFPLYLVRAAATGVSTFAAMTSTLPEWRTANDYDHINLIGRILSAIFDTVTIGLVFLIGRRIYNAKVGLLAAVLLTFTVQNIQLAHFYAFDVITTTVIVAAIYFGVRVVQDGQLSDSIWLGAMVALAIASKFSAMPLLAVIVLAHTLRPVLSLRVVRAQQPAGALGIVANPPLQFETMISAEVSRAFGGIMISLVAAVIVFAIASPFTFLDFNGYTASISEQSDMVRGVADLPYTRQYRNTGPFYFIENLVLWGLGVPLGLAAIAGFILVLARAIRRTANAPELLMLTWVIPYALITFSFQVKFLRYLAPLTPFLCLMAAYLVWRVTGDEWRVPKLQFAIRNLQFAIRNLQFAIRNLQFAIRNLQFAIRNLPLLVVLASTILYAFAFLQIYSAPLTRVRASEWIYRNIPPGKSLTDESWDDSLPFARIVDGRPHNQGEYKIVTMNLHEPDDARKLELLKQWIRSADYIVISSNRMYGWLPRLAERFSLTKRYYDLLIDEKLGFKLAAQFTSYPRLGPLEFNDDHADESFTVYDHPKVLIYEKVRSLSDAEFATLFAGSLPVVTPNAPAPVSSTRDKPLMLDRPVDELPTVNDRAWNPLASVSQWLGVLSWWVVVELLGWLALPLTITVFRNFADRGYIFSKSLGLLIVAYLMWLLASLHLLIQHALVVWAIAIVLLALSMFVFIKRRELLAHLWRNHRKLILFEELLFALAFLGFVFIRMLDPDLWQPWNGGEKSMEFAFLNAILRSPYFPPYDPYFAGGYINYYYYGIYLVGVLIKLSGIAPEVAFNLAIPTLFALTVANAFSVAYNLTSKSASPTPQSGARVARVGDIPPTSNFQLPISKRALLSGLLAALFIATIGNLDGMMQIVEGLSRAAISDFQTTIIGLGGLVKAVQGVPAVLIEGKPMPAFDYWRSSRVIPFTINEFPLWSFLFADLHPHMIGIPFTVLAIALASQLVLSRREEPSSMLAKILSAMTLALTLGAIAVINTWDAPTYLGLGIGIILLKRYWSSGWRSLWPGPLLVAVVVGFASVILYWPFFSTYKALFVGLGVADQRTELQPFLVMWGFFLFAGVCFILAELARRSRGQTPARFIQLVARHAMRLPRLLDLQFLLSNGIGLKLAITGLVLLAVLSGALLLLGQTVLAILVWPFAFSALLLLRRNVEPRMAFLNWLAFWAFAILLGVEVVYLQDFLGGGEYKRMNTLFKFYIQVWVLLSLLAAVALPELWTRISARRGIFPAVWQTLTLILIGSSLIFTFVGTMARVNDRFPGARPAIGTLDGLDFMSISSYTWPNERNPIEMKYDLEAIRWLNEHVSGTPVIAEAAIGYYREGGLRVSSYTGFPTLVGMHQGEQRYSDDVGKRDGEARDFFNSPDSARAMQLIRQLHIHYIYIGQLERVTYDAAGLAKFDAMRQAGVLDVVYQNPKVMIYRVRT